MKVNIFNTKEITFVGTWNVWTLWKDGSLKILLQQLGSYRWDIIGLAEVWRTGSGSIEHDGNILLYAGHETQYKSGVGKLI